MGLKQMIKKTILLGIFALILLILKAPAIFPTEVTIPDTELTQLNVGHNYLGQINISKTTNLTIKNFSIKPIGFPFDISFSPNQTSNLTYLLVNVSADVGANVPAGSYDGFFYIEGTNITNRFIKKTFVVLETRRFNVTNITYKKEINAGDSGLLGYFTIENKGNADMQFKIVTNGTISPLIDLPSSVTVIKNSKANVSISYMIPKNQELGKYNGTISVSWGNWFSNRSLEFSVNDAIKPKIEKTNFENKKFMATLPYTFSIWASDNVGVKKVYAEVFYERTYIVNKTTGKKAKENVSIGYINFSKQEEKNKWSINFNRTDKVSKYYAHTIVEDSSGNKINETIPFEIVPLNVVRYKDAFTMKKKKFGFFTKHFLFELLNKTNINLTLKETTCDCNLSIVIVRPDGAEIYISPNKSQTFNLVGNYTLKVKGTKQSDFHGKIKLQGVPQHVVIPPISFSGEFINYALPDSKIIPLTVGFLNRSVIDTGDPATSKVILTRIIPLLDYGSTGDEIIMTQKQLKQMQDVADKEKSILLKSKGFWTTTSILMMLLVVGLYIIHKFDNVSQYIVGKVY